MNLSTDEVKMLAAQQREMDAGVQPYVMFSGNRCAINHDCLDALGLEAGQSIDGAIFQAMCLWNIEDCQRKIAERETAAAIAKAQAS